jgi:nucleoside-diphosphate-sugar epimerase
MYGKVSGQMTEETPFNPCSRKGEIRATLAATVIDAWRSGGLTAMIARAADFYGPDTRNGVPNLLVFEPFSKGQKASWLVNDSVPHSYTYTADAARGLIELARGQGAWNQTWHLPTAANPPPGKQFIGMAASEFGVAPKYRVLTKPMIWVGGLFNPLVAESYEMLYQNEFPYIFDSSKFAAAFGFAGTSYAEGIRTTAASFKRRMPSKT